MQSGKVKWFDDHKGYGFITDDEGGGDLFAHYSEILGNQDHKTLRGGQAVEFEAAEGSKGPVAKSITIMKDI